MGLISQYTERRKANVKDPDQGSYKRVLCVCTAGLLRSPTAALLLADEPYNFNTRSAGVNANYALVLVNDILVHWADEIVCMEDGHQQILKHMTNKPIICLNIPNCYKFRSPELFEAIRLKYNELRPVQ